MDPPCSALVDDALRALTPSGAPCAGRRLPESPPVVRSRGPARWRQAGWPRYRTACLNSAGAQSPPMSMATPFLFPKKGIFPSKSEGAERGLAWQLGHGGRWVPGERTPAGGGRGSPSQRRRCPTRSRNPRPEIAGPARARRGFSSPSDSHCGRWGCAGSECRPAGPGPDHLTGPSSRELSASTVGFPGSKWPFSCRRQMGSPPRSRPSSPQPAPAPGPVFVNSTAH